MPVERMVEKARKLLESGKVERLDYGLFNVVGDHGTYTVVESYDGKISCNCPGFANKGRCSHSVAVASAREYSQRTHQHTIYEAPSLETFKEFGMEPAIMTMNEFLTMEVKSATRVFSCPHHSARLRRTSKQRPTICITLKYQK